MVCVQLFIGSLRWDFVFTNVNEVLIFINGAIVKVYEHVEAVVKRVQHGNTGINIFVIPSMSGGFASLDRIGAF